MLRDWVGEERAKESTGRISAALAAAAASARDPSDFYDCTPQSIGQCVAIAALTSIMPGTGAAALAYVVPQRARKGEQPQLQFMFSHRGLNALARRTGQTMIPIPVGHSDEIDVDADGGVRIVNRDIDNPPMTENDLRGVVVVVKEIASGKTITRGWVPKKVIDARKAVSRSASSQYGPWANWPVEMAMKTAMHYAISRGWCVIDDASATRGVSEEHQQDLRLAKQASGNIEGPTGNAALDSFADTQLGDETSGVGPVDESPQEPAVPAFDLFAGAIDRARSDGGLNKINDDIAKDTALSFEERQELSGRIESKREELSK